MSGDNLLHDEAPTSKYFHVLPNMYDDDLDPFEYRLIGHYKRVGTSWEGVRKTATICKMSVGKVTKTRKSLEEKGLIKVQMLTRKDLKDRGLVNDLKPDDKNKICVVTVVDVMEQNVSRYKPVHQVDAPVHHMNTPVHGMNDPVHHMNERITLEVEPLKNDKSPKGDKPSKVKGKSDTNVKIDAVISAYVKGLTTAPAADQYGNPNRPHAKSIMLAGFTPEQVMEYTKVVQAQDYWTGKKPAMSVIANGIAAYFAAKPPQVVSDREIEILPKPVESTDDIISPEQVEEMKRLNAMMVAKTNANTKPYHWRDCLPPGFKLDKEAG